MPNFAKFVAALASAIFPSLAGDWNPRLAAAYLDAKQKSWLEWPVAKGPNGACFSCHTGMTYLLARPALRRVLGESQPTAYETAVLGDLRSRVDKREAKDISRGFTKEPLASQAVGVESVLSALFLAQDGASPKAFDRLWSLQIRDGEAKGAWNWFSLKLDPFEMPEPQFYGASLAALAVGSAPERYQKRPEIRENIADLIAYLKREQATQPLHKRLMLVWAATKLPEALPKAPRRTIVDEIWRLQQPDGGWTLQSLGPWKTHETAPEVAGSNSYATAFATLVLEKAGTGPADPRLVKALGWLSSHQDAESGSWAASSMNKVFEPGSMQVDFMRDAATAFASLALAEASQPPHPKNRPLNTRGPAQLNGAIHGYQFQFRSPTAQRNFSTSACSTPL